MLVNAHHCLLQVTTKDISKGDIITPYYGAMFSKEDAKRLPG